MYRTLFYMKLQGSCRALQINVLYRYMLLPGLGTCCLGSSRACLLNSRSLATCPCLCTFDGLVWSCHYVLSTVMSLQSRLNMHQKCDHASKMLQLLN